MKRSSNLVLDIINKKGAPFLQNDFNHKIVKSNNVFYLDYFTMKHFNNYVVSKHTILDIFANNVGELHTHPTEIAALNNSLEMLRFLSAKHHKDDNGSIFFAIDGSYSKNQCAEEVVKYLIKEYQFNLDHSPKRFGTTPLNYSMLLQQFGIARLLINHGASPFHSTHYSDTFPKDAKPLTTIIKELKDVEMTDDKLKEFNLISAKVEESIEKHISNNQNSMKRFQPGYVQNLSIIPWI